MSFTKGFEKTAFIGAAVGQAAGLASKATSGLVKGVKSFAAGQRVNRVNAYRGAASGKGELGARQAASFLKNNPNATAEQAKKYQSDISKNILGRSDRLKSYKENKGKSWFSKHPVLTATGGYMAASHLMKDNQPPPPPPQVVQY
jgi:hypothetical protein